jgi:hypothetical protein
LGDSADADLLVRSYRATWSAHANEEQTMATSRTDEDAPLLDLPRRAGGVMFGTTILNHGVRHTRLGRKLMRVYNHRGIFSNFEDDLDGIERVLAARFQRFELDVVGAVALFAGWTA